MNRTPLCLVSMRGEIGEALTFKSVAAQLAPCLGKPTALLWDSTGGSLLVADKIAAALDGATMLGTELISIVEGACCSAAGWLAVKCSREVLVTESGHMLLHRTTGPTAESRAARDEQQLSLYARRTHLPRSHFVALMDRASRISPRSPSSCASPIASSPTASRRWRSARAGSA